MSILGALVTQLCNTPAMPASAAATPLRTKDLEALVCTKCGQSAPVATGFYLRGSADQSHHEGDPMQPCKACVRARQRSYKERAKARGKS